MLSNEFEKLLLGDELTSIFDILIKCQIVFFKTISFGYFKKFNLLKGMLEQEIIGCTSIDSAIISMKKYQVLSKLVNALTIEINILYKK